MKKILYMIMIIFTLILLISCNNKYTITFDGNGGYLVSGLEYQEVESASEIKFPVYKLDGYKFIGWDKDISIITEDTKYYAKWEEIDNLKVTIDINNGMDMVELSVKYNESINEFIPPIINGYTFDNLYYNDSPFSLENKIKENITLEARYKANEYKLYVDCNNGKDVQSYNIKFNEEINLQNLGITSPTKEGYNFTCWTIDDDNSVIPNKMPAYDLTIKANWEIKKYQLVIKIKEDVDDYDFNDIILEKAPGDIIDITLPSIEGYRLTNTDSIPDVMPADNLTIELSLEKIEKYMIKINYQSDNEKFESDILYFEQGEDLVIEPKEITGYKFVCWNDDIPEIMPNKDLEITGIYELGTYSLKLIFNEHNENIYLDIKYGDKVEVTLPNREHYDLINVDQIPEYMPANDVIINLIWSEHEKYLLSIIYDSDIKGKDEFELYEGDDININLDPCVKTGYTFIKWSDVLPEVMPGNDIQINAIYEINQYTLTICFNDDTEDIVIKQDFNSLINVKLPTKEGYFILNSDLDYIPKYMPAFDKTVNLTWVETQFEIKLIINGDYLYSDTVNCAAGLSLDELDLSYVTKKGHTLIGWDPEIPDVMPAHNITLNAIWEAETYTIKFQKDVLDYLEFDSMEVTYGEVLKLPNTKYKFDEINVERWQSVSHSFTWPKDKWNIDLNNNEVVTVKPIYTIGFLENGFRYFYYGSYPQTHVSDEKIIEQLNSIINPNENGYYVLNGEEYAKIKAKPNHEGLVYRDGTSVKAEDAWFKVEPIKWSVKAVNNLRFHLSTSELLDTSYFATDSMVYSESYIRHFLNSDFYGKVFTDKEKERIELRSIHTKEVTYKDNTVTETSVYSNNYLWIDDIVSLLEFVLNRDGDKKYLLLSDYALARNAICFTGTNKETGEKKHFGYWWLREQPLTSKGYVYYYNPLKDDIFEKDGRVLNLAIKPIMELDFY